MIKINIKKGGAIITKSFKNKIDLDNYVFLVRFLTLSLFAKTLKSVLVGTLKSTVIKLSVSKAVIFSISVGA